MNKMNKFKSFRERNKKSNGYLLRKASFNVAYKIVRAILLFGLCFLILQPLLNKISISFMEEQDLYDSTINVIPRHFTLSNYKISMSLMSYWSSLGNTLSLSACPAPRERRLFPESGRYPGVPGAGHSGSGRPCAHRAQIGRAHV